MLHHLWDLPSKIIAELCHHHRRGVSFMTAADDHDPIAERTSLGCDLCQGSRPKDNPDGTVGKDRSRIAEPPSVGSR
jgi:hypothetical protein